MASVGFSNGTPSGALAPVSRKVSETRKVTADPISMMARLSRSGPILGIRSSQRGSKPPKSRINKERISGDQWQVG